MAVAEETTLIFQYYSVSRPQHQISLGAYSHAMHSRLKAAPTITISEREILRFSRVRT